MIDVDAYIRALDLPQPGVDELQFGGQELILGECIALLHPHAVWFPLPHYCETLIDYYTSDLGRKTSPTPEGMSAVYFGTPTIVNDEPLFDVALGEHWTKDAERQVVRNIVAEAEKHHIKRIVSGLGSGDISPAERITDMGGGSVVCWKKFRDFEDWVFVRDLF